jgi:hypothetical protein
MLLQQTKAYMHIQRAGMCFKRGNREIKCLAAGLGHLRFEPGSTVLGGLETCPTCLLLLTYELCLCVMNASAQTAVNQSAGPLCLSLKSFNFSTCPIFGQSLIHVLLSHLASLIWLDRCNDAVLADYFHRTTKP